MKNDRPGEHLWHEWDGELYDHQDHNKIVYYTEQHIDLENDIVKRALASSLQRDGVVDTLVQGFRAIEHAELVYGWAGILQDELVLTSCDEFGETFYGDLVENLVEITFIEI